MRAATGAGLKALSTLTVFAEKGGIAKEHDDKKKDEDKPERLFRVAMNLGHELAWRERETPRGKAIDLFERFAWHDKAQFDQHRDLVDRAVPEQGPARLLAASGLFVSAAIKHHLQSLQAAAGLSAIAFRSLSCGSTPRMKAMQR